MDINETKALLQLLAERSAVWQALWTTFYTVSAAMIALVASGKYSPQLGKRVSAVIAGGFFVFAVGNFSALNDIRLQRMAICDYVAATTTEHLGVVAQSSDGVSTAQATTALSSIKAAALLPRAEQYIVDFAVASKPPALWQLCVYHWGLCLFVLLLMWAITKYQKA